MPKKRGRPPKLESEKIQAFVTYVRLPLEFRQAITKYQRQNFFSSESEAIRDAIKKTLKKEGLL